jgi:hypothetical protein
VSTLLLPAEHYQLLTYDSLIGNESRNMNKVAGKITVKESGIGIPNLQIIIYDWDPENIPEEHFSESTTDKSMNIWQNIPGDRIGSVITDESGGFQLEYEDSAFQVMNDERPNLVLLVVGPEDQSVGPYPTILHVSGLRQNAGGIETYLIKIPADQLIKSGLDTTEQISASRQTNTDNLLSTMQKLANNQLKEEHSDQKPFSNRYKERQKRLIKKQDKSEISDRPAFSFNLSIPSQIQFTDKNINLSEAKIEIDKDKEQFLLRESSEAEPIPLSFKGVQYIRSNKPAFNGLTLLVNKEEKNFRVAIPTSPAHLELPENEPSSLYNFHLAHRWNSEVGEVIRQGKTIATSTSPKSPELSTDMSTDMLDDI